MWMRENIVVGSPSSTDAPPLHVCSL